MPVKVVHYNRHRPGWADDPFMDWLSKTLASEGGTANEPVLMAMEAVELGARSLQKLARDEFCVELPDQIAREMFGICSTLLVVNHVAIDQTIQQVLRSYLRTYTKAKA